MSTYYQLTVACLDLMSSEAHRFGHVEFCISNICRCFLQAGAMEKKIKIQHVQIDELPRTLKLHKCNHALILYLLLVGDNPRGIVMRRLCNLERSQRPRQSSQRGGKTSTRTWNPVSKVWIMSFGQG